MKKNDYIDIEASTAGRPGRLTIGELPEYRSTIEININGKNIPCPKFAYVNGKLENSTYSICEGDSVVMENYYTVAQLFEFLDVNPDSVIVNVNNSPAEADTKVYENFNVQYTDRTETEDKYENLPDDDEYVPKAAAPTTKAIPNNVHDIHITVNGIPVTLKNKSSYKFVDVLDFYPFDMSKMGGTSLITAVNGIKADFSQPIKNGDAIELRWA